MKRTSVLILCLLLSSCGDHKSKRSKHSNQFESTDPATIKLARGETYVATLKPVNPAVTDLITGAVTINLDGDFMATNVRISNSLPNVIHAQSIHLSSLCPTEIADENADGYIDVNESMTYTSDVIIPMDGDLNSQTAELGMYPVSDNWGAYIYSETNSFLSLMNDLVALDENLNDEIIKLPEGAPLDLINRTVVIYGAPESITLPETVANLPNLTRNQSIPIACGTFTKIETLPGEYENDDVTVGTIGSPNPRLPGQYPGRSGTPRPTNPGTNNPNGSQGNRTNNGSTSPQCPRGKTCPEQPINR